METAVASDLLLSSAVLIIYYGKRSASDAKEKLLRAFFFVDFFELHFSLTHPSCC